MATGALHGLFPCTGPAANSSCCDAPTCSSLESLLTERSLDPSPTLILEIAVDELIAMDLPDVVVERPLLELRRHVRHVRSVQVINGLKPG